MIQKGLFAIGFPMAISFFVIGGLLFARPRQLRAWAVPAAALVGIGVTFLGQFHDLSGIDSRWERWKWVIPSVATVLVLWPILAGWRPPDKLMRIAWWVGGSLTLAGVAGRLAAGSVYPEMEWGYRWIVPAAVLVMSLGLLPLAASATSWDVAAVVVAALVTLIIVVGSGFSGAAEVASPAVVAGAVLVVAAVAMGVYRVRGGSGADEAGDEGEEDERGKANTAFGGALAIALLLPIVTLVAWVNTYSRSATYAWAMALPIMSILLLWAGRIPRLRERPTWGGVIVVLLVMGVSVAGLALALQEIDLRAYGF